MNIYKVNKLKKLIYMIKDPINFFENVKGENWKPALTFFPKLP